MTIANLFLIYGVHHVVNVVMGKEKPSLTHYMAVVMEVLLLGYESLAEMALKLMNCVSIGFLLHLNFEGGEGYHPLIYEGLYENLVTTGEQKPFISLITLSKSRFSLVSNIICSSRQPMN